MKKINNKNQLSLAIMITLARSCELTVQDDKSIFLTPYLPYKLTMNRMIKDGYKEHMQYISNRVFNYLHTAEIDECVAALKKAIDAIGTRKLKFRKIETLTKALAKESGMKPDDTKRIIDNLDDMNIETIKSVHLSNLLDALHVVNNGETFGYLIGKRRAEVIFELCFNILSEHTVKTYLGEGIINMYDPNYIERKEFLDFLDWVRDEFKITYLNQISPKLPKQKKVKKPRDKSSKETRVEKKIRLEREANKNRAETIKDKIMILDDEIENVMVLGRSMIIVTFKHSSSNIKLSTPNGIKIQDIIASVKYELKTIKKGQ